MKEFPKDKLLKDITPKQYCIKNNLNLDDFTEKLILSIDRNPTLAYNDFIEQIPEGTEVVVNYFYDPVDFKYMFTSKVKMTYIDGIALIPKKK